MLEFKEYLHSKKIDADAFLKAESTQYDYLKNYFDQVSPNSFTAQKLFLINDLRRKYLYKEIVVVNKQELIEKASESQVISKPVLARTSVAGVKIPVKSVVKSVVKAVDNNDDSIVTSKPNTPARPKIPSVKIPVKAIVEKQEIEESSEVKESSSTLPKPNIPVRPKIPGLKSPVKAEESDDKDIIKEEVKPKATLAPKIPSLRPKIPPKKSE